MWRMPWGSRHPGKKLKAKRNQLVMADICIVRGQVWHRRTEIVDNAFTYPALYCLYPLGENGQSSGDWLLGYNRKSLLSLLDRDLGSGIRGENALWVNRKLAVAGIDIDKPMIEVLTMPRLLGFVFNPVSFWFCRDREGLLRAVVCEVHNTFRDRHSYVCAHDDGRPIANGDELFASKDFHVSPFFARDGQYRFRFVVEPGMVDVHIDYLDNQGALRLGTGLRGSVMRYGKRRLASELLRAPLVSIASSVQIGFQALVLRLKKVAWHHRPKPLQPNYSRTLDRSLVRDGDI